MCWQILTLFCIGGTCKVEWKQNGPLRAFLIIINLCAKVLAIIGDTAAKCFEKLQRKQCRYTVHITESRVAISCQVCKTWLLQVH